MKFSRAGAPVEQKGAARFLATLPFALAHLPELESPLTRPTRKALLEVVVEFEVVALLPLGILPLTNYSTPF